MVLPPGSTGFVVWVGTETENGVIAYDPELLATVGLLSCGVWEHVVSEVPYRCAWTVKDPAVGPLIVAVKDVTFGLPPGSWVQAPLVTVNVSPLGTEYAVSFR